MSTTPQSERSLTASIAAHESWRRTTDPVGRTAPARRAFDERFAREVDPAGTLDPAERARQAAHARKAYFLRLALKSAKARRKAKEAAEELAVVDRELAELGNGAA